jgi:ankyrin repeat protein
MGPSRISRSGDSIQARLHYARTGGGNARMTYMFPAIEEQNKPLKTISFLLRYGASPDAPEIAGLTAIHHHTIMAKALPSLARLLLEQGKARVNYRDRYGTSPICSAMMVIVLY